MVDRTMRGVYPILAMPFDEKGRIDVEDLRREVEFAIEAGVHGLGIALASEIFKLSEAERDLATRAVVEQARGRVKIVVNTGAPGTDLAVQYSRRAEELGADATMVLPPTAVPTTSAEIREYYRRISDAISIPIFIQDVPTAPVGPSLAVQIARESERACYAKVETPPTPPRVTEAIQLGGDALIVFGGAGGNFYLEELRRGSVGTMPACAIPEVFRRVWDMYQDGKDEDATRLFDRYQPLLKQLGQGLGLAYYLTKEVLRLRGVFKTTYVRHPAAPPDDLAYTELRQLVESLELEPVQV
jgi:4-hydroxy-tetrahydrodipicolinate synthase